MTTGHSISICHYSSIFHDWTGAAFSHNLGIEDAKK